MHGQAIIIWWETVHAADSSVFAFGAFCVWVWSVTDTAWHMDREIEWLVTMSSWFRIYMVYIYLYDVYGIVNAYATCIANKPLKWQPRRRKSAWRVVMCIGSVYCIRLQWAFAQRHTQVQFYVVFGFVWQKVTQAHARNGTRQLLSTPHLSNVQRISNRSIYPPLQCTLAIQCTWPRRHSSHTKGQTHRRRRVCDL